MPISPTSPSANGMSTIACACRPAIVTVCAKSAKNGERSSAKATIDQTAYCGWHSASTPTSTGPVTIVPTYLMNGLRLSTLTTSFLIEVELDTAANAAPVTSDRKSTRLNSSHQK